MEIKKLADGEIRHLNIQGVILNHHLSDNTFNMRLRALNNHVAATAAVQIQPSELEHSLAECDDFNALVLSNSDCSVHLSFESIEAYMLACELLCIECNAALCEAFERLERSFMPCNPPDEDR